MNGIFRTNRMFSARIDIDWLRKWGVDMQEFTHFNEQGRAKMVDITNKKSTYRKAVARSSVFVNRTIYDKISSKTMEKGDVLAVAQVAGVMAAKNTSQWIPMCHPIQ